MPGHFPYPLRVEFLDGNVWELLHRFGFDAYTVPARTRTDFASIPKLFRNLISPTAGIGKAAVIHDWLYTTGQVSKRVADRVLRDAMKVEAAEQWESRRAAQRLGARFIPEPPPSAFKRWIVFQAVNWFGGNAWAQHRQEDIP